MAKNKRKSKYADMSCRDINLANTLREQQVLQLHTRIEYLKHEERKKQMKIDQMQKLAHKTLEFQLENKNLQMRKKIMDQIEFLDKKATV